MAIELHHLNTHGMMEQAGKVLDGVACLKERIAELEKNLSEIQSQKMQLEDDVALLRRNNAELKEAQRWRKCSEEKPQNYDDGEEFLIAVEHESTTCPKGYYVAMAELVGGEWTDDEGRDIDEDIEYDLENSIFSSQAPKETKKGFYRSKVTHWMPLPSAPKEGK